MSNNSKKPIVINLDSANKAYTRIIIVESFPERESILSPSIIINSGSALIKQTMITTDSSSNTTDPFEDAIEIKFPNKKNTWEYESTFGRSKFRFIGLVIGDENDNENENEKEIIIIPRDLAEIWIFEDDYCISGLRFIPRGNPLELYDSEVTHMGSYGTKKSVFKVEENEQITGINIVNDDFLQKIQFVTDRRSSPTYGNASSGKRYRYILGSEFELLGFAAYYLKYLKFFQPIIVSKEISYRKMG